MSLLSAGIASVVSLFSVTYVLQVPHRIAGKSDSIVKEYYEKNYSTSLPLDVLLIGCYLWISLRAADAMGMHSYVERLIVVSIITAALTTMFCIFFRSQPRTSNFFSRWFHSVGYASVVYDVILLKITYIVYMFMQSRTQGIR